MKEAEYGLLEAYFSEQAAKFPGKVAYLYADMKSGKIHFEKHGTEQVVSASMIKVPIMMAMFHLIEEGVFSLFTELMVEEDEILSDSLVFEYGERKATVYELMVWMIVNSDNTATNVLLSAIGEERLHSYFKEIGLSKTKVERRMLDYQAIEEGRNNYISPMDFFSCMKQLQKSKEGYAALALDIMKRNRDFESLCRYLYEGPVIAHKTGSLDNIAHDAGVIETMEGSYFLGIFVSEFLPKPVMEKEAQKLMGRLSRKIYDWEIRGKDK